MPTHDRAPAHDHMPEDLLAEAAAGLQSDRDADVLAEAAAMLTAERVSLRIIDRLAAVQVPLAMTLRSGCLVEGCIEAVGDGVVVVVDRQGAEHCIAVAGVETVRGLPPALSAGDARDARGALQRAAGAVTWGRFLRGEPTADVRLVFFDGTSVTGLPALVGADHVDLLMPDGTITTCSLGSVSRAVRRAATRA